MGRFQRAQQSGTAGDVRRNPGLPVTFGGCQYACHEQNPGQDFVGQTTDLWAMAQSNNGGTFIGDVAAARAAVQ